MFLFTLGQGHYLLIKGSIMHMRFCYYIVVEETSISPREYFQVNWEITLSVVPQLPCIKQN